MAAFELESSEQLSCSPEDSPELDSKPVGGLLVVIPEVTQLIRVWRRVLGPHFQFRAEPPSWNLELGSPNIWAWRIELKSLNFSVFEFILNSPPRKPTKEIRGNRRIEGRMDRGLVQSVCRWREALLVIWKLTAKRPAQLICCLLYLLAWAWTCLSFVLLAPSKFFSFFVPTPLVF